MKLILISISIFIFSFVAMADCLKVGDTCTVQISSLHPAQFSVGLREINLAVQGLSQLSAKKLEKEILKKPALVVLGPENTFFVVDRNHFARELIQLGVRQMQAQVIDDASTMTWDNFWSYTERKNEIYLYDEKGNGPLSPNLLPIDLLSMKDDPYRSLAVAVRDQGGYSKVDVLFADFQWAQFFRSRVVIGTSDVDFDVAIQKALVLCKSPESKDLPGANP